MSEELTLDNPPARAQVREPSAFRQYLDRTFKYWAILPTLLILVVFTLYPVFQLLRMSVSDIQFVDAKLQWTFVGLKYVDTALNDAVVPDAFRNTLLFVVVVVLVESVLGLILAFAVSRASVVLPVPAGPQRMRELGRPDSSSDRKAVPGATRWRCPPTSSSERGRIRAARGAALKRRSARSSANRSSWEVNCPRSNQPESPDEPRCQVPRVASLRQPLVRR